jgi:hypothetical protein
MNVEIGAEAVLLPEKEYIRGIFVAVQLLGFNVFTLIIDYTFFFTFQFSLTRTDIMPCRTGMKLIHSNPHRRKGTCKIMCVQCTIRYRDKLSNPCDCIHSGYLKQTTLICKKLKRQIIQIYYILFRSLKAFSFGNPALPSKKNL